jgi:hypothetical protein
VDFRQHVSGKDENCVRRAAESSPKEKRAGMRKSDGFFTLRREIAASNRPPATISPSEML